MFEGPRTSSQKLAEEIRQLQEEVRALRLSLSKLNAQLGDAEHARNRFRQGQQDSVPAFSNLGGKVQP